MERKGRKMIQDTLTWLQDVLVVPQGVAWIDIINKLGIVYMDIAVYQGIMKIGNHCYEINSTHLTV